MKFRLLWLKEQKRATADFAEFLKPLRSTNLKEPITEKYNGWSERSKGAGSRNRVKI